MIGIFPIFTLALSLYAAGSRGMTPGSLRLKESFEENSLLNALTKYLLQHSWRNVFFLIKEGGKPLHHRLSMSYILSTIHQFGSASLFNLTQTKHQMEKSHCKIIVWCEADEQVKVIEWAAETDLFQTRCTWLFVMKSHTNLRKLVQLQQLQKALRPDSRVFALSMAEASQNPSQNWTYEICKFIALGSYPSGEIPCHVRATYSNQISWKISLQENKYFKPLQGFLLKAGTIHLPPISLITHENNKTYYHGLSYFLVDLFSRYLGFTATYHTSKSGGYGSLVNESWDGLMGLIQRKEVDFLTVQFSVTAARLKIGDYTSFGSNIEMSAMIRKPEVNSNVYQFSTYTEPFPIAIWLLILAVSSLACACLVVTTLPDHMFYYEMRLSSLIEAISRMLWTVGCSFLLHGITVLPSHRSGLLILLFYLSFMLVISKVYCSFLTASLTFKPSLGVYNSMEELLDDGKYGISIKPTAMLATFQTAKEGTFSRIWTKVKQDPTSIVNSDVEGYEKAYKDKFVYVTNPHLSNYWMKINCSFVYIKKPVNKGTVHYFMSKNSPYLEAFRQIIISLQTSGIMKRLNSIYLPAFEPEFDCPISGFVFPTTALHQAVGAFIVYACAMWLSIVAFTAEIIYEKCHTQLVMSD